MKMRPVIALTICLIACQASPAFAAGSTVFTGQRLGSCGNLPARLAQNLSISPWTGDGHPGFIYWAEGRVEIPPRASEANPAPRHYAQITVTPDRGWSLEDVQVSWRLLSPASGRAIRGTTITDVWAFSGTNEHAAASFGSFSAPPDRFAFLNWTPKLQADPGQPITFRFYASSLGPREDSRVLLLDDVRLSGRMMAAPPSVAELVSPFAVALRELSNSIRKELSSLRQDSSSIRDALALLQQDSSSVRDELTALRRSSNSIRDAVTSLQQSSSSIRDALALLYQRSSSTTQSLAVLLPLLREQQQATQACLISGALITVSGLLSFLLTALVLLRAQRWFSTRVARQDEIKSPSDVPSGSKSGGSTGPRSEASDAVQQTTSRYLGALERLEKKIRGLEQSAPTASGDGTRPADRVPQNVPMSGRPDSDKKRPAETQSSKNASLEFDVLLGRGQALFSLNHHEEAQRCFAEALLLQPENTDVLVRNGLALERLQRFDEAIACYERAITVDPSLSMAWLHLGRICNRLERHLEASACYERAVRKEPRGLNAPS
jgi:tetratricopeptide (TPR) repeat protein